MKILRRMLDARKKGFFTVLPEQEEDLWFLYNIIKPGDYIRLRFKRKVQDQTMTGLTTTSRRLVKAKLEVLQVDFDYDSRGTSLYCKTKNLVGNQYLETGQMQSVDIPIHYPLTIYKSKWDEVSRDFLTESIADNDKGDVGVLLIEDGRADAYYMKNCYSLWQGRVEKTLPRKKTSLMEFYKKAFSSFQEKVLNLIENIFDLDVVKCFIIAGPGTSSKNFFKFLESLKDKVEYPKLKRNFAKFLVVQASSSQKSALTELMDNPTVQKQMMDTKAMKETTMLNQFYSTMRSEPEKAVYGDNEVLMANSHNAIEHLLIADGLFRSHDFRARRRYINLVDQAKSKGVQVHIFSDLHPSGQKLKEITGIAGILKFALDPALLDICHADNTTTTEQTVEEEEDSQTESETGMNDIADDDQFDTYTEPVEAEGEDI